LTKNGQPNYFAANAQKEVQLKGGETEKTFEEYYKSIEFL